LKCVILAGGLGTRLSEETSVRPKPMVEIGGRPMLWHIMKLYSAFGIDEFVVCLGFKGYMVKEYFINLHLHTADVTVDVARGAVEVHETTAEPWRVTLADTGEATMTGGRLARVRRYVGDEAFCMTYGDGLADVDLRAVVEAHRAAGRAATVTAVRPPGRYGAMAFEGDEVRGFAEKPEGEGGWINGGFFVLEPSVLDLVDGDDTVWEQGPMERLAASGQLHAYRHRGWWQAMDTLRDKHTLEALWASGSPPWAVWR
jgi:glucose-1-phosphate cytidylyltransferase